MQIDAAGGGCKAETAHLSPLAAALEAAPGTAEYCHQGVLCCCCPSARWALVTRCRARCSWRVPASNPPPCMSPGELPNSLQEKKQIQLFYLESEERMCEIKEKNIALKLCFSCRFPCLAAEVTPILNL